MSPFDLYRQYTRLSVPLPFLPDADVTVTVHRYQNYAPSTGGKSINYHEDAKQAVVNKWDEHKLHPGASFGARGLTIPSTFTRESIFHAHSGKGSPTEIRTVLQLVALYGLGDYSSYETDAGTKLNAYCENYIGLDCNGFAGNFARLKGSALEPNSPVSAFSDGTGTHRHTTVEQIRPGDAIVEAPSGDHWPHVALVQSAPFLTSKSRGEPISAVSVIEAVEEGSAHGLYRSDYQIDGDAAGHLFKVKPPYKADFVSAYIVGPLVHVSAGKKK